MCLSVGVGRSATSEAASGERPVIYRNIETEISWSSQDQEPKLGLRTIIEHPAQYIIHHPLTKQCFSVFTTF